MQLPLRDVEKYKVSSSVHIEPEKVSDIFYFQEKAG